MPQGAKEAVVKSVAADLKKDLCDALWETDVRAFFRNLAKSVGGQPPPSLDYNYSDEASDFMSDL